MKAATRLRNARKLREMKPGSECCQPRFSIGPVLSGREVCPQYCPVAFVEFFCDEPLIHTMELATSLYLSNPGRITMEGKKR